MSPKGDVPYREEEQMKFQLATLREICGSAHSSGLSGSVFYEVFITLLSFLNRLFCCIESKSMRNSKTLKYEPGSVDNVMINVNISCSGSRDLNSSLLQLLPTVHIHTA